MRHLALLFPLLALLLAAPSPAAAPEPAKTVKSGDWTITWTSERGKATGPGGREVVLWEQPAKEEGCEESVSGDVLSVVGTLVSLDSMQGGYCEGAAHPYASHTFVVRDLAASPKKQVTLYDFFDKAEVQRALDADAFLKKHKDELDSNCEFTLSGFESSFAFHHVEGKKVAVRVGLTHGCEAARGNLTQLGLLLTPKPDFLARLKAAEQAGTLMKTLGRKGKK